MSEDFKQKCKKPKGPMSVDHKMVMSIVMKGKNVGEKNGSYGERYVHCTKLRSCSICGKEVKVRAYGSHFDSHNKEKRELINKKISIKRLQQVLPTKDTQPEIIIQKELQKLDIPFEKHKSIMDFCQPDLFIQPNVCIFCDGDYWHNREKTIQKDNLVNKVLSENGFAVIRFWEHQIHGETNNCVR